MQAERVKLKERKCAAAVLETTYLGSVISFGEIRPDPEKIQAIRDYPKPRTLVQLQSFVGLANYYRSHCANFSNISKPLTELMCVKGVSGKFKKRNGQINNKLVEIVWTAEGEEAFERIKDLLCKSSVLIMPNFEREFYLATDACDYGYGGVLTQILSGNHHPIAYYSKGMSKSQRNYATSEKELLAIVM